MGTQISNKTTFLIYIYLKYFITILVLGGFVLWFFSKNYLLNISLDSFFIPITMVYLILIVFERILRPTYFEFVFKSEELSVKIFTPSPNSFSFYFLNYRKYLSEIIISKKSFNGYSINISNMGLRKILLLQQNTNDGILESKPISLGLTSLTKYTQLIIALDKFKSEK